MFIYCVHNKPLIIKNYDLCSAQVAHKAKLTYSEKSGKKVKFAGRKNPQEQLKKFILLPTYS